MLNAGAARQLYPTPPNERTGTGGTVPLMLAAKQVNPALLRLLLEKGGDEQLHLVDRARVGPPPHASLV